MKPKKYDFGGWATRNNLRCSDGRTIVRDAFKDCDGLTRPLVWNHQHNSPDNVLGHGRYFFTAPKNTGSHIWRRGPRFYP
ncbi:hypothetical protein D5270_00065 [Acutalibacter sp. 1XD8-36]|nr:hypothetical protein [Acutalibacter sp. 1XD8-36]